MTRPPKSDSVRVLLIGRHFWPHGSIDSAAYLIQLATDLKRHGIQVEVLTPQYASSWPTRFTFRELTAHRGVPAPRFEGAIVRDWSVNRYVRSLTHWICEHASSFHVLMVDRAQEELIAAIEAAKILNCATLVRVGGWDQDSDLRWWQTNRAAGRCMAFARRADAVITKSPQEHRELIANAFDRSKLIRIDDGFDTGVSRSVQAKIEARRALAAINGDLAAPADMPVVLCCAPMTTQGSIRLLVESVRVLVARYPSLRFWFIGDGPYRDSMYEYLRGEGVRASIAMPGSFADMTELFVAADVYVQLDASGLDWFLRQAVSAELPIVSIDDESTRSVLGGSTHAANHDPGHEWVAWYQPNKIKSLRTAIRTVLDDRRRSLDHATKLRRWLCRQRPQHRAVDAYVQLIERLAVSHQNTISAQRKDTPSIETAS